MCVLVCAQHKRYVLRKDEDCGDWDSIPWLRQHRPIARQHVLGGATLREETLLQMRVHGIEHVRSSAIAAVPSPSAIAHEIATLCNLCTRCGSANHLVHECRSTHHVLTQHKLPRVPSTMTAVTKNKEACKCFELDVRLQEKEWRIGAKAAQDIRTMARKSIDYALHVVRSDDALDAKGVEAARQLFLRHTRLIQRLLREPDDLQLTVASRLLLKQYALLQGKHAHAQLLRRAAEQSPRSRNKFIETHAVVKRRA